MNKFFQEVMVSVLSNLENMYTEIVGQRCGAPDGQSILILQTFCDLCSPDLEENIKRLFIAVPDLAYTLKENRNELPFYHQSIILFLIYMLKRHRNHLIRDWPLDRELLARVATNIGVSLDV